MLFELDMHVAILVLASSRLRGRLTWTVFCFFFFQAEDGIRDLVRSRGLGDVYKRQARVGGEAAQRGGIDDLDLFASQAQHLLIREALQLSLIHI